MWLKTSGFAATTRFQRAGLLQEVRGQNFDCRVGRRSADRPDHLFEVLRAAIGEIVAVDRGNDDVAESHLLDGLGDVFRLVHIKRIGLAGRDVAEGAGAGADLTHDHEGRVFLVPAFADIWTAGFLAHRHQLVTAHQFARLVVALGRRRLDADPFRLAHDLGIRPMGLFRVADTLFFGRSPVENSDHKKPVSIACRDHHIY